MIEVGQNFGKYRLLDRLAVGGMAEIFRAVAPGLDGRERIVAIKRVHRSLCEDAELTQMLVDEARISVLLDHPNIAQVFDLGSIEGQFFMVMAYIDGVDCHEILDEMRRRREYIPIPAILHIISETCAALHYAHNRSGPDGQRLNIVHRDVSPQNVMVGYDGAIKLVDFGIAKAAKRAQTTQAGVIKGKFYYMAPEQAHGNFVDGRTDVFSAGMVLYEMLTARSPYDDIGDAELLRAVRMANIPPPSHFRPDLDPQLDQIVMTAVQKDPNRRFQSAYEMQRALDDYANRVYPPVDHREQMAHFLSNLFGRPLSLEHEEMERENFRPSGESMIFDRPNLDAIRDFRANRDFASGQQSADGDQTMVWDHEAHRAPAPQSFASAEVVSTQASLPSHRLPPAPQPGPLPHAGPTGTMSAERSSVVERMTRPVIIYAAIGVALALVVILAAVIISGREPQGASVDAVVAPVDVPAEDAPPAIVHLALNSIPTNAAVRVNGEAKGSTPLSVPVQVGEKYLVEIERAGFETWKQELDVTAEIEPIEAELNEAQGVLKVSTFPPDAEIILDGKKVGTAPYSLAGLESGRTYKVEVKLGDKTESREVVWKRGDDPVLDLMFELEKPPEQGAIALDDVPDSKPEATATRSTTRRKTTRRSSSSSTKKTEAEELDVWGGSKSESKPEPKADDGDESLDVWGGSKKKKTTKKKKTAKPETEEKLDIW